MKVHVISQYFPNAHCIYIFFHCSNPAILSRQSRPPTILRWRVTCSWKYLSNIAESLFKCSKLCCCFARSSYVLGIKTRTKFSYKIDCGYCVNLLYNYSEYTRAKIPAVSLLNFIKNSIFFQRKTENWCHVWTTFIDYCKQKRITCKNSCLFQQNIQFEAFNRIRWSNRFASLNFNWTAKY